MASPLTSDIGFIEHPTKKDKNGNPAKKRQFQQWVFTWNNYTEADVAHLQTVVCRYICFGREVAPTTGTHHLQGFVHFSDRKTLKQVKATLGTHPYLAPQRGTNKQNLVYCGKDSAPFVKGKILGQGHRSDLDHVADMVLCKKSIAEIATECPSTYIRYNKGIEKLQQVLTPKRTDDDMPMVLWIWGPAGAGKTRLAKSLIGDDDYYIKDNTKWWDGYYGEKIVLVDDFRPDAWRFEALLRLCDRGQYRVEVKGAYVEILALVVLITCPDPPSKYWFGNDLAQIGRRLTKVIDLSKPDIRG